ncbi:hypothetical protein PHYBOEH_001600 [Phytophthora boehmeriae]|uniref:Uncharacterized protein n=1 Tax=Phytophthora boehmeriae TaxID=109152 RepID=A0A8T1V9T2_9STRA|nr:hypothetical protein PHYBOEH_001600 [Phytophthora boehmeriae]
MAIDLHTTAELVESFDIDEFMEAVDSVRSTATITPQMRDQDSTSDGSDDMVDDCGSDAPIAAHDEETKKKPRRARRVTSKEHILKLREIVKQLTKQLDALKTETRPGVQSNATKDGRLIRSSSTSLWMQAALRQRERRRKAEADNDSLREMLQMQIEEASCLKRILKRRAKIKVGVVVS